MRRYARPALLTLVLVSLVIAYRYGVFERFGDPARVRLTLLELGPWGIIAFVASYAALQPFGVPGTVFIMAAPLIWPWPTAFALSMCGTMAASVVGFSFARFVARDALAPRIPETFKRFDRRLAESGFVTVFLLRLVFWMPPLLHAFFGLSRVPFWTHFWGSLLGYVLPLLAVSYFGQRLFDWMRHASAESWAMLAVATLTLGLVFWWAARRFQRRSPSP